jgi:hypothetical protein
MKVKNQKRRKPTAVGHREQVRSSALEEQLIRFKEYHPSKRFSRNLRTMLIEFLMYDGATEANYLQDLLYDLQGLFELLEAMQFESET